MAGKGTFFPVLAANPATHRITGSFAPAGTGAVTAVKGRGFTVARTATAGKFLITLRQKYTHFIGGSLTLQLAATDDLMAHFGVYSASAGTLEILVRDISGAALSDIAANADNRVHFDLAFQNSATPAT
jgi:hypothetical protein